MTEIKNKIAEAGEGSKKQTLWNMTFFCIFVVNAAIYLSQQMMNSLVAKYADSLGVSASAVGVVTGSFAISALLFKIFSGPACDTFNRKYILMLGMMIMAASYLAYSASDQYGALILSRLLQGTGQAFATTCLLALAADALPSSQFGTGIGIISMAQAAAQAIGPTLALKCTGACGYKATFMLASGIMICAVVVAFAIKTEKGNRKKFRISLEHIVAKEAVIPSVVMFFLTVSFSTINAFLILYAGEKGVVNIGYYFTVYAVTLLFSRPLVGRLQDRYGMVRVIFPAMMCFAASFLLISGSDKLWMFLLSGFIAAFGYGACQPALQTLTMKCVGKEKRGAASSTNYIGADAGNLVGPILAGIVVERFGYVAMWRIMIIPMGIAMAITCVFHGEIRRIETKFQTS